jgi:hypothetical protein
VTDSVTGLIWLKEWNCRPVTDWAAANQSAHDLRDGECGLTDRSSPGDWRLPTKEEWAATIAFAARAGCTEPSLTDDSGRRCYSEGGVSSFMGLAAGFFWSSTTTDWIPDAAWTVSLRDGLLDDRHSTKSNVRPVWPVRSSGR